jgi:hypothetical protein
MKSSLLAIFLLAAVFSFGQQASQDSKATEAKPEPQEVHGSRSAESLSLEPQSANY